MTKSRTPSATRGRPPLSVGQESRWPAIRAAGGAAVAIALCADPRRMLRPVTAGGERQFALDTHLDAETGADRRTRGGGAGDRRDGHCDQEKLDLQGSESGAIVRTLSYDLARGRVVAALTAGLRWRARRSRSTPGSCCQSRPTTFYRWDDFQVGDDHMGHFADEDQSVWIPEDHPDYAEHEPVRAGHRP